MGGSNNFFLLILLILPIVLVVFMVMKRKKAGNYEKKQRREEKDEVWATVKKYLRQTNETGKEVIDTFTVKRPNPYDVTSMTKEQKIEYKQKLQDLKNLKKTDPAKYKQEHELFNLNRKKRPKEIYLVVFTTRDTKTGVEDAPRILECEVIMKKVEPKKTQRIIEILGLADYEKEMKWIKPIKDKQDKVYLDRIRREQERKQKLEAKQKRKEQAEGAKNKK